MEDAHQVAAVQVPATLPHSPCMEGVHRTTQAGLQVAAVASTQAFQLVAADIILDLLEDLPIFRPFLEASQTLECLPRCTGHVVHQVVEDVGPKVEVEVALQEDAVQVPHTLHHGLHTEDVDLAVLLMEL